MTAVGHLLLKKQKIIGQGTRLEIELPLASHQLKIPRRQARNIRLGIDLAWLERKAEGRQSIEPACG